MLVERVTGIEPALSAWESASDLHSLSWETGVQLRRGRVPVTSRESPLIAVQSGTHLARDLALCGRHMWLME
ncbi:hypothetical protein GCM10023193_60190 [Planotetraspora kaengkrachanensis]|uniref:Uncharacterized protein n=1 Tax=Planotetraspora kaengkrachanensis TaxID=575193 RepID=A0A8J3PWP0_9ACTN|nr:hypothetical protein Pka01_55860 [Planotetraspora kaengkrachanensis]